MGPLPSSIFGDSGTRWGPPAPELCEWGIWVRNTSPVSYASVQSVCLCYVKSKSSWGIGLPSHLHQRGSPWVEAELAFLCDNKFCTPSCPVVAPSPIQQLGWGVGRSQPLCSFGWFTIILDWPLNLGHWWAWASLTTPENKTCLRGHWVLPLQVQGEDRKGCRRYITILQVHFDWTSRGAFPSWSSYESTQYTSPWWNQPHRGCLYSLITREVFWQQWLRAWTLESDRPGS